MRLFFVSLIIAFSCAATAVAQNSFDRYFTGTTLRLDYFHTGTKGQEVFSLDQAYEESPWPGSRIVLLDTLNRGEYFMRVYDRATNALIYSRGFSTIFNEWQTTDEAAAGAFRSFSETVRFPFPRREVQVTISRRDKRMVLHELFSTTIDPTMPGDVSHAKRPVPYSVTSLVKNGDPAEKVDIVILGDGYTKAEMEKFRKDARHLNDVMFSTPPFSIHKSDFNVWTIEVESKESGIDIPGRNVWKNNPLGCRYDTFGSARYVLTTKNQQLRDIAAAAPYDFICILINDTRYGGGGIFNLYATTYTNEQTKGQEWQSDYMYVHEFGHSFAGLADEYYTSSTGYNDFYPAGVEPWEPNITADVKHLKWEALVTRGIPIPTPWQKAQYDSLEALRGKLDRLAADYYEKREPLQKAEEVILKDPAFVGKVGAFEGAGYVSTGLYRPSLDCRMFSLSLVPFDAVCSRAIEQMIAMYAGGTGRK